MQLFPFLCMHLPARSFYCLCAVVAVGLAQYMRLIRLKCAVSLSWLRSHLNTLEHVLLAIFNVYYLVGAFTVNLLHVCSMDTVALKAILQLIIFKTISWVSGREGNKEGNAYDQMLQSFQLRPSSPKVSANHLYSPVQLWIISKN